MLFLRKCLPKILVARCVIGDELIYIVLLAKQCSKSMTFYVLV